MTTKLIDNHPLTQRKLQFISISVNKLTLNSINIMQSSNNFNVLAALSAETKVRKSKKHISYENPGYLVSDDDRKI